jgi:cellulose synthase/poly-beta-1,6-N-acetylglucosamine synthase-like glycosyltransferase
LVPLLWAPLLQMEGVWCLQVCFPRRLLDTSEWISSKFSFSLPLISISNHQLALHLSCRVMALVWLSPVCLRQMDRWIKICLRFVVFICIIIFFFFFKSSIETLVVCWFFLFFFFLFFFFLCLDESYPSWFHSADESCLLVNLTNTH